MISLGLLSQIYLVSMIVGGGFIGVNLFMGNLSDGGDDGGGGGGGDDVGGGGGAGSADAGGGGHDFGGSDGAETAAEAATPGEAMILAVAAQAGNYSPRA